MPDGDHRSKVLLQPILSGCHSLPTIDTLARLVIPDWLLPIRRSGTCCQTPAMRFLCFGLTASHQACVHLEVFFLPVLSLGKESAKVGPPWPCVHDVDNQVLNDNELPKTYDQRSMHCPERRIDFSKTERSRVLALQAVRCVSSILHQPECESTLNRFHGLTLNSPFGTILRKRKFST